VRTFQDDSGGTWSVYEVSADTLSFGRRNFLPSDFREGWLVFESGEVRRRLAPRPPEWQDFPVSALRQLLERAETVDDRSRRRASAQQQESQPPL
jgi:hypothetical protein